MNVVGVVVAAVALAFGVAGSARASGFEVMYSFQGGSLGNLPDSSLVAVGGTLYGTTYAGGAGCPVGSEYFGCGTVFSLDTTQAAGFRIVHEFDGADGGNAGNGVVAAGDRLYGSRQYGGQSNFGVVFALHRKSGSERVLYSFSGGTDGGYPVGNVVRLGGKLYGTTAGDGLATCNCGTVFAVDIASGTETVLHGFQSGRDGADPKDGMIDVGGTLYGTTSEGGGSANCAIDGQSLGCGTVFALDPASGEERIVYAFKGGRDAAAPQSGLIAWHGQLYGTTAQGGTTHCRCGTVYTLDPSTGVERVLYRFHGEDGANPQDRLAVHGGKLFGTTFDGGTSGFGTVFSFDPTTAVERVVHSFQRGNGSPFVGLVGVGGKLYGTDQDGGTFGDGYIFAITP